MIEWKDSTALSEVLGRLFYPIPALEGVLGKQELFAANTLCDICEKYADLIRCATVVADVRGDWPKTVRPNPFDNPEQAASQLPILTALLLNYHEENVSRSASLDVCVSILEVAALGTTDLQKGPSPSSRLAESHVVTMLKLRLVDYCKPIERTWVHPWLRCYFPELTVKESIAPTIFCYDFMSFLSFGICICVCVSRVLGRKSSSVFCGLAEDLWDNVSCLPISELLLLLKESLESFSKFKGHKGVMCGMTFYEVINRPIDNWT